MRFAYKLEHKRTVEIESDTGEKITSECLLGFFSSEEKCREAIPKYLEQPGFKDYPNDFVIEKVEADVDDYNDIPGEFILSVFDLTHEWYDGEYDYITDLGYYSTKERAEESQIRYQLEPEFIELPDGFNIDEHEFDKRYWTEGFFTY